MSTGGSVAPKPPCFGPAKTGVSDLVLNARGIDSVQTTGAAQEEVGAFSTPPVTLGVGTTLGVGGMYYAGPTAPVTAAGCVPPTRDMSFGWAGVPIRTLTFSYGNLSQPATGTGGAWWQISAASLGGGISWSAAMSQGRILPGERIISNVLPGNRFAILTYVSGPSNNTTGPYVSTANCMPYAQSIGCHFTATSTTDIPQIFRVDFYEAGD